MRILIVGCGSIGMRHLRNLRGLGVVDLAVCDPVAERRERASRECGARAYETLESALEGGADVAFITTPPHLHIPLAMQAARAGCHLFIEKPLSHTEEGLDDLAALARRKNLISMVGCNMRFHHGPAAIKKLLDDGAIGRVISAILDAGQYMPDWHPGEDYRRLYSAQRALGGGVVLDGIHEIDYARWLFGEVAEVFCYGGHLSRLDVDVEDSANILLNFQAGFSAIIHVDYIQRAYARSCKVIGEEGTIHWDITAQMRWFSAETKQWHVIAPPPGYDINDMYVQEAAYFLECAQNGRQTMADLDEASRVTRIALAVKRSMQSGAEVAL